MTARSPEGRGRRRRRRISTVGLSGGGVGGGVAAVAAALGAGRLLGGAGRFALSRGRALLFVFVLAAGRAGFGHEVLLYGKANVRVNGRFRSPCRLTPLKEAPVKHEANGGLIGAARRAAA